MELRPAFNGNSREVSPTPFKGGFMDKTLLVPLDNTEVSEKIIREADACAAHLGSRVSFLHVINPNYSLGEEKKPLFEERFEKAIHSCEVKSKYEVLFRVGKPYPKILEMEEELKPLMILMAAHDHTVLERLFLGSNTDHILHHGHTPVWSIRVYPRKWKIKFWSRLTIQISAGNFCKKETNGHSGMMRK